MTIQPGNSSVTASPETRKDDLAVTVEKVPWSQLAQEFAETWGRADESDPQPEHVEDIGMNGSGKTLWMAKVCQERMLVRHTPVVFLQSKPDDQTIKRLGWPVITNGDVKKVMQERWSIYWPQTKAMGDERELYQADQFEALLNYLWRPNSNIIVVFDDIGYIQGLYTSKKRSLNKVIEMYLREGRSQGITCGLIKQRPQGARREMHSETQWTVAFKPKDESDSERFAEVLGNRKKWMPVFDQMNADNHEFLIRHARSNSAYISWVDTPLRPLKRPDRNAQPRP